MFSGSMTMPSDTSNVSPDWHHLEVHIFDKQTGSVVESVIPVISVTSEATGQAQPVPLVVMQGIVEGPGDYHFGNNVDLPKGDYTVTVVIGSETASFAFSI